MLAAGQTLSPHATAALEKLCQTYWFPLYAFVRRHGYGPHDAQDLTQGFFARFLEKDYIGLANPARGRFRSFLLACLKNFLFEEKRHAGRLKRGGGQTVVSWDVEAAEERLRTEPVDHLTPETIYERRWALALLEQALARLGEEEADNTEHFTALKEYLWGEKSSSSYMEIGARLAMTEGAVKVAVHRLRHRYRELLREEVAHTVASHEEIERELRHLLAILRG